ncbi:magnesium and cobalt transport protein CorA [Corynebacterium tapiri]|uniref:Magnesium and cobalt transport protein CorA n=1 Tax=Corynebacterium tapiri TaxID=1448266 RepID=A0A5C4U4P9_9CORY|nr:magnesium and cobalt transport protein CorA [Corynebacterium tapiri]TNL97635.1 magnesium and cobalt transport protein CorA [Corynebacterium tapiri]
MASHSPGRTSRLSVPVEGCIEHCRIIHNGERLPGEYHVSSAVQEVRGRSGAYVWLALNQPSEEQMTRVAEHFNIHELIVEDAVAAHQRPKVERYDDQLFIVVRSVLFRDDEEVTNTRDVISTGEVQMLLGPDFIITVRHNARLPQLFADIDSDPEHYSAGPSAIAYRVSDFLVDQYVRIAGLLGNEVDELEEEVFTPGSDFSIDKIYLFKREILEMRHATDPLAGALNSLIKDHKDLIPKKIRSYFRDVLDHEAVVKDHIDGYDQRLTSLLDASVAKVTLQQNQDMRAISAFVGLAAVPTLIAGIYGMNFDNMPELQLRFGYYFALAMMFSIMGALFWWFRKNHWL